MIPKKEPLQSFVCFRKQPRGRSYASAAGVLTVSQNRETSYAQRLTSIQFDVSTIDLAAPNPPRVKALALVASVQVEAH